MKGFRTIIANAFMTLLPIIEMSGITAFMSKEQMIYYLLGVIVVNFALRYITTSPIGKSI